MHSRENEQAVPVPAGELLLYKSHAESAIDWDTTEKVR